MLREDELIQRLAAYWREHPRLRLGPGDDGALLKEIPGRELVLSVDAVEEGVHFNLASITLRELGHRALASALSDLAAMGAEPLTFLVDLRLPPRLALRAWEIYEGMAELSKEFCISPSGGNVSRSERLGMSVAVVGEVAEGLALTRQGALPGHRLLVTGDLGRPMAFLAVEERGLARGYESWARDLREKFSRPWPRIKEVARLLTEGIRPSAAIDISDGLGLDASRLAKASQVRVVITADKLPIRDSVREAAERLGVEPWRLAVESGEEYEVLLCMPPQEAERALSLGLDLTEIGRVEAGHGAVLVGPDGREVDAETLGYDHFAQ